MFACTLKILRLRINPNGQAAKNGAVQPLLYVLNITCETT